MILVKKIFSFFYINFKETPLNATINFINEALVSSNSLE